jgi:hypothetical protein
MGLGIFGLRREGVAHRPHIYQLELVISFSRLVFGCGVVETGIDVVCVERDLGDVVGFQIGSHHHGRTRGDVYSGFGRPVKPKIVQ